eukprot:CAMPEP_0177795248 /NCGR_PEP_ID=MMETSP0491_2-20121128/26124_1 /TAXON_ID=63592 /ORGANISM="Tetraselmis chuii, Strain PLY429" /LENGTH=74 /DNA_ID=CAMNT_0019318051 /DNA_START=259 /DNA_END=483 /DNA_ORIENTATION=-
MFVITRNPRRIMEYNVAGERLGEFEWDRSLRDPEGKPARQIPFSVHYSTAHFQDRSHRPKGDAPLYLATPGVSI